MSEQEKQTTEQESRKPLTEEETDQVAGGFWDDIYTYVRHTKDFPTPVNPASKIKGD